MSLFHVQEWYKTIVSGARIMAIAKLIENRGYLKKNNVVMLKFLQISIMNFTSPNFTNFLVIRKLKFFINYFFAY